MECTYAAGRIPRKLIESDILPASHRKVSQPMMSTDELNTKRDALLQWFQSHSGVIVAFSAGVDSTVVAAAAFRALGERALAVTAVSASLADGEREQAESLAAQIGIAHRCVDTTEFEQTAYRQNAPDRCFHCKAELYTHLTAIQKSEPAWRDSVLVNGANLDDRGDHRPGMQAAAEADVRSPLLEVGFNKQDVRDLAKHWNLPVWDKPAMPCLSSRVAYGVEVTPERTQRIDAAERFLKETLQVQELRVRLEHNDLARVELPLTALPRLLEVGLREAVVQELRSLGFRYITLDLEGFRSGSLNAVIPVESLQLMGDRTTGVARPGT